jgi:hypothetical protein
MAGITSEGAMKGVYTIEDLRARCRMDEETGCWLWGGASQDNRGMVWLPELGVSRNVVFAALYLTGRRPPAGQGSYLKCTSPLCCNPEHAATGTRKQISQHLARQGRFKDNPKHMAAVLALSKKARVLSDEQANEIRTSNEIGYVIAERMGVSKSVVSRIRRGQTYRPRLMAAASVFTFGMPAAA